MQVMVGPMFHSIYSLYTITSYTINKKANFPFLFAQLEQPKELETNY